MFDIDLKVYIFILFCSNSVIQSAELAPDTTKPVPALLRFHSAPPLA